MKFLSIFLSSRKIFPFFYILAGFSLGNVNIFSQNPGEISGVLGDSLGQPVNSATVSLINLKDSTLQSFYLTDDNGEFIFKKIHFGRYRIVVSRMGYFVQAQNLELTAEKPGIRLDTLWMKNNDVRMGDVQIIADIAPVTLKGDTLEFHGDAFRTAPNAMAEDLLKKLPGVEIQPDGTIQVNGQTVSKVLVDGKEFFSTDPKIATRNLPAEAINKVQVFDNKNEGEQLTGIDDGQTDMAINLTLKEKYKEGVFGQISAGGGTRERWIGKASVHMFTKKSQYSFIGNGNNTNEAAFSFMELMQFTGGMRDMMEGGGRSSMSSDDGIGFPIQSLVNSQNQGINTQASGGIRASRDWGEKLSLLGNYFVSFYKPDLQSNTYRNYFLPDSSYSSNSSLDQQMQTLNHRIEADFRYTPKKNTKFRFKPVISFYSMNSTEGTNVENRSQDFLFGTVANNYKYTETGAWIFSGDARFSKGFKRKGRTISVNWTGNFRPSSTQMDLDNLISFLQPDTIFAGPSAHQRWLTANASHNETFRLAYTEPFFYRWLSEFSINGGLTSSENTREAFSYNFNSYEYDSLVSNLSNEFHSQYLYGSGGIKLKRAGKKLTTTFGAAWQQAQLTGTIPTSNFSVERNFGKLLPNAQLIYAPSRYKNLTLTYRSSLKAPTVTQLQPLKDISNPVSVSTGNDSLEAQTDHSLSIQFRMMDPSKNRFLNFNLNGSISEDGIAQSQTISNEGISITKPINTKGNWNSSARLTASIESKKIKTSFSFEPRVSLSHSVNTVNNVENPATNLSTVPRLRISFSPTDSFQLSLKGDWTWSQSIYEFGPASELNSYSAGADLLWMLPKGFTLNSAFTYSIVQGNNSSVQVPLWTASLSKTIFKTGRGELKFSTFDVLNLNTGVSNSTTTSYIENLTFNTLNRYYLLSFTYRLTPYKPESNSGRSMFRIMH